MNLDPGTIIDRLSAMSSNHPIKRVLRAPIKLIPPSLQVPVLRGPLQGKRWIVGSSINRCWMGTYDRMESTLMSRYLRPGNICFDIGAQAGYHTVFASTMVGPAGRVFAFEPAPANAANIKKHVSINHLANVTVVEAAVSNVNGVAHFDRGINAVAGHLAATGELVVRTIALDQEIDSGALPEPDYIKIDAEGAELSILEGARKMLARRHPTLSIETHQWLPGFPTIREDCIQLLSRLGYSLAEPDPAQKDNDTHLYASPSSLQT